LGARQPTVGGPSEKSPLSPDAGGLDEDAADD